MLLTLANVVYVLVAVTMIVLILMQRGSGAAAGSGFGGGASSTVFGARGSSNFLSKSTKWLAVLFFAISLAMAWHASRSVRAPSGAMQQQDLGVMSDVPAAPPVAAPAAGGEVPVAPTAAPAPAGTAPAGSTTTPAPAVTPAPAAPAADAAPAPAPDKPQPTGAGSGKTDTGG